MLRVLVAEDSVTARRLLVSILTSDPEIEVVGQAGNGAEAIELCTKLRPDVVTMDIQMPVMDGIEATRRIMAEVPTPVVVVSSLDPADIRQSMTAFNSGALAVMAKPSGPGTPRFAQDARDLVSTVKSLAGAKPANEVDAAPGPVAVRPADARQKVDVVAIVASTGGPIALRGLFKAMSPACKPAIVIVQHIAAGFASGFADWLREATKRQVKLATDGDVLGPGTIYVAPDDRHVAVEGDKLVVSSAEPVDGVRPSGTFLLASLARQRGARAAGILLSGTGVDGVEGLRKLRDAGGAVFVQDQASCTTFETAGAALKANIVTTGTPLAELSTRIAELATA